MHPVRFRARFSPSSVGALMDPAFLRRAVNDMVATTDAGEGRAPGPGPLTRWLRKALQRISVRLAAASSQQA
jgi:hypothetical protein